MHVMEYSDVLKEMHHDPAMRSLVLNAPAHIGVELRPAGFTDNAGTTLKNDFALLFASHTDDLDRFVPLVLESIKPGAAFWIAFPRSGRGFDKEKLAGEMMLYEYEPMEQAALDAEWTAVRFSPVHPVTVNEDDTDSLKPPSW